MLLKQHNTTQHNTTQHNNLSLLIMGNNICASSRKCDGSHSAGQFGMLCKRPYDREVVVKFEKKDTYYKKSDSRKRKYKSKKRPIPIPPIHRQNIH